MIDLLEEYVSTLNEAEKIRIISDYETFEKNGEIGDEPIRLFTIAFLKQNNFPVHAVTSWMILLAGECHKHFSKLYREHYKL